MTRIVWCGTQQPPHKKNPTIPHKRKLIEMEQAVYRTKLFLTARRVKQKITV